MSDGIKRRDFLRVLSVGGAGATLTGCSTEGVERLLPYVTPPEDITPGVATWYTTVCDGCSAQCGAWVRTREGRVVKLEGNPQHPISGGALCSRGHATLQGLYNPHRLPGPMVREGGSLRSVTWDQAEEMLASRLQDAGGDVLFMGGGLGPTLAELTDQFLAGVGGRRVEYDPLADAPLREAARIAFGRNVIPRYDIAETRFLISFGADFLETWISPVEYGRGFARMSAVDSHGSKGQFVFAGSRLSLTGLNADEWVPVRPGAEAAIALGMANIVSGGGRGAGPYASLVASYDPASAARVAGLEEETIRDLAERFVAQGPSLALGPGAAGHHANATAANLAVLILNAVAGNVGRTLHLRRTHLSAETEPYAEMESAVRSMAGGQVGVAMVHGVNPAYTLPAGSGFSDAFAAVKFKVSFATAMDETAAMADLILPDRHFLEAWGDSHPTEGVYALRQPAMQPVPHFDAKQTGDVLLAVGGRMGRDLGGATFYDVLRTRWRSIHAASGSAEDFEVWWRGALKKGVVTLGPETREEGASLRAPDSALTFDAPALDGDGEFTLLVHPSSRFGAGEFANSPWMQELPDPVAKITWHSWLEMHPDAAARAGIVEGDIVSVTSPHGSLDVPVWLYPGIREDAVALAMGGGHTDYGDYANGKGVNAMKLLPAMAEQPSGAFVTLATRVSVAPTGQHRRLATVEGSSSQHDRPIAPAVALADLGQGAQGRGAGEEHEERQELQKGGGFVPVPTDGSPEAFPLEGSRFGQYENAHEGPRWAMAIDLDRCTGCSACITACQAENNVPWVGENQVLMGREMHWMRIERYYEAVDAAAPGDLDVRFLPMLCQQCNNAPCEPVCPVFATYHTPEGLNAQIYNRCVGTRYCANNCPYKVRVFNWYRYTDAIPEPFNWQWNPDVTVRDNGVMEKCSFCIQRIREAQNEAVLEDREVRDGDVTPACQQSCPAEAIVFGNIRDPNSRVARVASNERTYRVLDEIINTQPAVNYLKKVTFHEVASGEHA